MNNQMRETIYRKGFLDGLRCFAWWKDGVEFVGISGTRLRDAEAVCTTQWSYAPNGGGEKEETRNDLEQKQRITTAGVGLEEETS